MFLGVALVSAVALGWLGWLLIEQDAALDVQRRQEILEQIADRAAAAIERSIGDLQRSAASATTTLPDGVAAISIGSRELAVRPDTSLLYYPVRPTTAAVQEPTAFQRAERLEFVDGNLERAATAYESLTSAGTSALRATALARLARVRRKLHESDRALHAYDALGAIADADVDGLPAGLVARVGRASVFEEAHRSEDLRREAGALGRAIAEGRWRLTRSEYEFYAAQVGVWLGTGARDDRNARVRSEAAVWLWDNRASLASNQRRVLVLSSGPSLVVWQRDADRVTGAVADPTYLSSLCGHAVPPDVRCTLTDAEGRPLTGEAPPSRSTAVRTAAATGLPWTLHVSAAPGAAAPQLSPRRRLLLSVFGVVAVVLALGWYFIGRAMSRERRVSRLQSDFVAAVSHEFRSPLTSLSHIAEILAGDRIRTDDDRRRSYDLLVRETDRLRRLVEDLLEFGRFEAGAAVLRLEPLDIGALVRDTVEEFRHRVAADGYTVELSTTSNELYARADREALSRALWNLMDNAVKYSPECRTVWVDVTHAAGNASIVVRDRGLGIPAHEQREIFDRFVRGADSKARRINGTGIGLAMVREIVRAHGGDVRVVSEPGHGSQFTMLLRTAGEAA